MPAPGTVISSSYKYQLFVQQQTTDIRTINTGVTPQLIPFTTVRFNPGNPVNDQPFKTGSGSNIAGVGGRKDGSVSLELPWIPSGTAGTVPNIDMILQAVFGGPATIVSATSCTYAFVDAVLPVTLLFFDKSGASAPTHLYALGAVPTRFTLNLNGNFSTITVDFDCVGIGSSTTFSLYTGVDAPLAGGLGAFPAVPTVLTTAGTTVAGFGGTVTVDTYLMGLVRSALSIEINTGFEFISDGYADGYRSAAVVGKRRIAISQLTLANTDSTGIVNLKQKGFVHTPVTAAILHGTVAGAKVGLNFNALQFPEGAIAEDGAVANIQFPNAVAHATAAGLTNDFTMVTQ